MNSILHDLRLLLWKREGRVADADTLISLYVVEFPKK